MSLTRSIIFILLLLIGVSTSCHDKTAEPVQCTTGCQSVLAAKEFFLFKPGSWWVYEEEYSGVRDSMYVYTYANGDDYTFDIRIKSALDDFQYHYWPEYNGQPTDHFCSTTNPIAKNCMSIKRAKFKPGAPGVFVSEGRCMFFQYNLYDSVPSYSTPFTSNFIHIKSILNEYNLGNYNFGETVKILDPNDPQNRLHPTYHYYSKGVGLVRKELIDTAEVWNLVNYHIEE